MRHLSSLRLSSRPLSPHALVAVRQLGGLLVLVSMLSACFAGHALAQTDDERARARAEFERGVAAFGNSDYQSALDAFQEAYRLAPHPSVRLNIANCYDQLGRPVEALFHFEHYLTEASAVPAPQRREIDATIRRLRGRIGTLTLQVTPDGAEIVIDGTATRRAPVSEPVRVPAGDHTVVISMDGFVRETQTVHVDGGGEARVAVRLRRAEIASVAESTASEASTTGVEETDEATDTEVSDAGELGETRTMDEDEGPTEDGGGIRLTTPFFVAGGITLAAAVGWAITGGIAIVENDAFEADVARANDATLSEAVHLQAQMSGLGHADSARTLAIVSDVFLVTTLVGAGATTFFLILAQTEGDESEDAAQVMVLPMFAPAGSNGTLLGLSAAGTF